MDHNNLSIKAILMKYRSPFVASLFQKRPPCFAERCLLLDSQRVNENARVRNRRQIDFVHRSRTCSAMGGGGRPLNPRLKRKQDAYSGVNSACRENRQELDIRLSIYSGRGKHA